MAAPRSSKAVVRRLHALSGGPDLVRKAAARLLARLPPTDAAELLHEVIQLARTGDEEATCVLPAFTRALDLEAAAIPYAPELKRIAVLMEQEDVEGLFQGGDPAREYDEDAAKRADARLFSQSLGYLKEKARRTRNPDELARLAVASDPSVVRNVLVNPRLTEELVIRIAARRPARPEPLEEIWRSARWSVRPGVRRALVFNPYLPPRVGSKIVPLLPRADLLEVVANRGLADTLREQAALLAGVPVPKDVAARLLTAPD